MQCHYCHREASFSAETDGVRVGLCDRHFRDRFTDLAESDALERFRQRLDIDRANQS